VTEEEETYKITVHLLDGTRLKCTDPVTTTELLGLYKLLGQTTGRLKVPTGKGVMQFMPVSSIARIEARGTFS
jgi:hypothetical protein